MQVTIKLLKGELTVPALRIEGGLALHRDVTRPGYWSITHVPSGLRLWNKCSRNKADALVRFSALLALTDWDRSREDLLNEKDLYSRIRDLKENPPSAPRKARQPRRRTR